MGNIKWLWKTMWNLDATWAVFCGKSALDFGALFAREWNVGRILMVLRLRWPRLARCRTQEDSEVLGSGQPSALVSDTWTTRNSRLCVYFVRAWAALGVCWAGSSCPGLPGRLQPAANMWYGVDAATVCSGAHLLAARNFPLEMKSTRRK